jgi:hypothetical protein
MGRFTRGPDTHSRVEHRPSRAICGGLAGSKWTEHRCRGEARLATSSSWLARQFSGSTRGIITSAPAGVAGTAVVLFAWRMSAMEHSAGRSRVDTWFVENSAPGAAAMTEPHIIATGCGIVACLTSWPKRRGRKQRRLTKRRYGPKSPKPGG